MGEDNERSIADLLVDQIEFSDIILINKIDLITQEELTRLHGTLRYLNTQAEIIAIENRQIDLSKLLDIHIEDVVIVVDMFSCLLSCVIIVRIHAISGLTIE